MNETWKPIKNYEGFYEVSNLGRVKSLKRIVHKNKYIQREIILSDKTNGKYNRVTLVKESDKKTFNVHRLVAEHFLNKNGNKTEVNHIDGNKRNNKAANLEWVTSKENSAHAISSGLQKAGVQHHLSKLNREQILKIRRLYRRGVSVKLISFEMGVNYSTVWNAAHKRTYKSVT